MTSLVFASTESNVTKNTIHTFVTKGTAAETKKTVPKDTLNSVIFMRERDSAPHEDHCSYYHQRRDQTHSESDRTISDNRNDRVKYLE